MSRTVVVLCVIAVLAIGSHAAEDPYEVTTPGAPGTGGVVPTLIGEGPATPNSANMLYLTDAAPTAPALLVFSMSELAAPFAGGVLGPAPDFVASLGATDARGALERRFRMPVDAPAGLELFLQAWVSDAGAVAGLSASNTVRAVVQPSVPTALLFPAHIPPGPSFASGVTLGDFDNDGLLDAVMLGGFFDNPTLTTWLGRADGAFHAPIQMQTPGTGQFWGLESGDLNGDGHLDLAATLRRLGNTWSFCVYLGVGDGSFTLAHEEVFDEPYLGLALADLDLDGILDVVLANRGTPSLVLRRGLGDGSFIAGASLPLSIDPTDLLTVDLDLDGAPDVVTLSYVGEVLEVRLGQGDGSLGPATSVGPVPTPLYVATSDVDQDGLPDLVVTSFDNEGTLSTFRGLGGGALSPAITTQVTAFAAGLWLGDLDGDGFDDAVVSGKKNGAAIGQAQVLLGNSDGSFEPTLPLLRAGTTEGLVSVGDFGGDGVADLLVAPGIARPVVLRGAGGASFVAAPRFGIGPAPRDLSVDDLDGDGEVDLIVVSQSALTVRRGVGDGTFGPQESTPVEQNPSRLLTHDLDGDGHPDVVLWSPGAPSDLFASRVRVRLNLGGGELAGAQVFNVGGRIGAVHVGDVDHDGDLDLVGSFDDAAQAWVIAGDGTGGFASPATLALGADIVDLALSDLDADGLTDLALLATTEGGEPPARVLVRLGLGGGAYGAADEVASGPLRAPLHTADVDGDGAPDLITDVTPTFPPVSGVRVLLGAGDGNFASAGPSAPSAPSWGVSRRAFADITGDGRLDIVSTLGLELELLPGLGDGTFAPPTSFATGLGSAGLGLADFDHDGDVDIATANGGADNVWVYPNRLSELRD